jgi:hypothetical protein
MLYRVGAKVLNGRDREQRFVDVEAVTGDEAAAAAHKKLRDEIPAGVAILVEDVRPAPPPPEPEKKGKKAA